MFRCGGERVFAPRELLTMVASGRSFDDELAIEPKKEPAVIIGVPKEVKRDEYRVGMLPVGVEELMRAGHRVLVQQGAGVGSGLPDSLYEEAGARIVETAAEIFAEAELIVKVKEPLPQELAAVAARADALHVLSLCRRPRADRAIFWQPVRRRSPTKRSATTRVACRC